MRWLIIALLAVLLYLYGVATDELPVRLASKPIPVIALLFWLRGFPASAYRNRIALGLVFSLVGDVLLAWPADLFVFGLGAFLLAHLAYLSAYLSDSRRLAPLALAFAASTAAGMFGVLTSAGLGPLLVPVALYALTIGAMLWRALARIGTAGVPARSARLAAGGAALFVLSDSLIGIDRFVMPFEAAPYAIILSYWAGQWAIAASAARPR